MNTLSYASRKTGYKSQNQAEIQDNSIQSQSEVVNMLRGFGQNSFECQDSLMMTDPKMPADVRGQTQPMVSYYYPLRGHSSIVPQGTHQTEASYVQPDEDFINNERVASEFARQSQMNFKNAMKIQNQHLNHMIGYLKSEPIKQHMDRGGSSQKGQTFNNTRKSVTRKSAGSRNSNNSKSPLSAAKKFELTGKRLLNASQVSRDKIQTPQQYKLALEARRASRQILEEQRRAAQRQAKRLSGTRFASTLPNAQAKKSRARSYSNQGSMNLDRKSFLSGSRRHSSNHAQSDHKRIRRRLPSYPKAQTNLIRHPPKKQSVPNQYHTQQQPQPHHLNLNDYQQMTEPNNLIVRLRHENPHYSSTDHHDHHYSKTRNDIRQEDYGVNSHMASAQFAMSSNNQHNISNEMKALNTNNDFSGYVDTTPNESSVQDQNNSMLQQHANLRQPPLPDYNFYGNPRIIHVQNNTFGQEDVQSLADAYNFELQHNNQNIFDHRQKLSGITSDGFISNVNKDSSLQHMSNNKTRELTEKGIEGELSSMLSNQVTSRTNQRSKHGSKKSHVKTKSSISSKKDVLSHRRLKDSRPKSNESNSVTRSIRSFIGLKNKTGSGLHSVKNSNKINLPTPGTRIKVHQSYDFQINSHSHASLATAKTFDCKFKNQRPSSKKHQEAQILELKKLLMQKQLAKADRYYFDQTIRKYFCKWIEKFIDAIRNKNTLITHHEDVSQQSKSKSSMTQTQKLISKQNRSHTSLTKSEIEDDSSKNPNYYKNQSKSSHMFLNQLTSPGQQIRSDCMQGGDWLSPNSHLLRQPVLTLTQNRINDKGLDSDSRYRQEDQQITNHSLQESILNIDSKNNLAIEKFFAPQNAFKTSKVTRNISTMVSIENQNQEFKQTAQLGQQIISSGEKRKQAIINDPSFKKRLSRGLKIISRYNSKKLEVGDLDQKERIQHQRSRTASCPRGITKTKSTKSLNCHQRSYSQASKSGRSKGSRSKSGASRSVSQKSHSRCASRISNPSKNVALNRSTTIPANTKNQIFNSLDNQRTLKGENYSQLNIRQTKFLEQPQKLLHSQRPVAVGIRESRSLSPIRQSLKTTSFDDETSCSRQRPKLSERQKAILRHFYTKWFNASMVQSSRYSRRVQVNPRKVHRFNLKLRVLRALNDHMIKQRIIHESADFVYHNQIQRRISRSFLAWIQAFNENRIARKNQYVASCHWVQSKQHAVFKSWRRVVIKRRIFRSCIRQVVPATCLLLLIRFSPSMPRGMNLSQFIGQELFECTKYIQMSSVDQRTVVRAFSAYQRNFKMAVFNHLKNNYFRVCSFKASVAMKITKGCIRAWRQYSRRRRIMRRNQEAFNYKLIVKTISQIVHFWKFYSKTKANVSKRLRQFKTHRDANIKRQLFNELSRYSVCRAFKNQQNKQAIEFINRKLKSNLLTNLIAYNICRQQKKIKANAARDRWAAKTKVKLFQVLKSTIVKLQNLENKYKILSNKHHSLVKSRTISEWRLNFKIMAAARLHYQFRQKANWFQSLKEAVLVSQIRSHSKKRAASFLKLSLKQKLVNFLRDFKFEQNAKKQWRAHTIEEVAAAKKRLVFQLFILAIQNRLKNARLTQTLVENFKMQLKSKILQRLAQHVVSRTHQRQFEYFQTLKFKADMFDFLKLAVVKQKLLRDALISTIEKRNRQRAERYLEAWRRAAVFKYQQKQGLFERQIFFTARRVIYKIQRVQAYNACKLEIEASSIAMATEYLLQKYFNAMKQFKASRYVQAQRLARHYRRKQLLAPAFVGLKKRMCLKHIQNQLQKKSLENTVRLLFNSWIQLGLTRKLEQRALAYLFQKLKQKSFKILVNHRNEVQKLRIQDDQVSRFISTRLAKTAIQSLKIYPKIKQETQALKEQKSHKLALIFLSHRLHRWSSVARHSGQLRRIAHVVRLRQEKRIEVRFWKLIQERYLDRKKQRKATLFVSKSQLAKVFQYLKSEAIRTKKIEALGDQFNRPQRLMKAIFMKVLEHRNKRIEARNVKKWGTKDPNTTIISVKTVGNDEAMVYKGRQLKGMCFDAIRSYVAHRLRLKHLHETLVEKVNKNLKQKFMREICESIIIQPKLDAMADHHRLRASFRSFIRKVAYIRDRNNGFNMHEFEVRAYDALGKKLMRKAFTAFKMMLHTRCLKEMEARVVFDYQMRKWFSKWRHNYLVRARASYLLPPIDKQNFRERHGSRSKSKSRERLIRSSKKKTPISQVRRADFVVKSMNVSEEKLNSEFIHSNPYESATVSYPFSLPSSDPNLKRMEPLVPEHINRPIYLLDQKQFMGNQTQVMHGNTSMTSQTQLNDTVVNLKPHRFSPGKQPKQSPQKLIAQIDQSDERLYHLAQTMNEGLKDYMVIDEHDSELGSQGSKVPPFQNLTQKLQKFPMNGGQNSFKAFLSKKAETLDSPKENSKEASGQKSNMLSNQSLNDDSDTLPTALYQ